MTARLVGVQCSTWVHAVWVPDDLPEGALLQIRVIARKDRGPITQAPPNWRGKAECGQMVSHIHAGPNHGHDWDLIGELRRCPRCVRVIARGQR